MLNTVVFNCIFRYISVILDIDNWPSDASLWQIAESMQLKRSG